MPRQNVKFGLRRVKSSADAEREVSFSNSKNTCEANFTAKLLHAQRALHCAALHCADMAHGLRQVKSSADAEREVSFSNSKNTCEANFTAKLLHAQRALHCAALHCAALHCAGMAHFLPLVDCPVDSSRHSACAPRLPTFTLPNSAQQLKASTTIQRVKRWNASAPFIVIVAPACNLRIAAIRSTAK